MRVETDRAEIAAALRRTAETIRAEGGFVADDLIVRERDGQIWCAVGDRPGEPGRILVSYAQGLTVPLHEVEWVDDSPGLELADPTATRSSLTWVQWELLENWLMMVNSVDRIAWVRAKVPRYAVTDPTLRHHLANAGYPVMRRTPTPAEARETAIAWHSMGAGKTEDDTPRWRLIPLKHLFNHHPEGADQNPEPGRTAVATSATSNATESFENYGDLDAMQLLMSFGYVDAATTHVHSVPTEVESKALGRVVVRWRAPRNPRALAAARDVPTLGPLERDANSRTPGGIELRHLTIRSNNRARVATYLAMACQSMAGLDADAARRESEAILDAILAANLTYYRQLDELVVASANPFLPLTEVSLLQQQRLTDLWG